MGEFCEFNGQALKVLIDTFGLLIEKKTLFSVLGITVITTCSLLSVAIFRQ